MTYEASSGEAGGYGRKGAARLLIGDEDDDRGVGITLGDAQFVPLIAGIFSLFWPRLSHSRSVLHRRESIPTPF